MSFFFGDLSFFPFFGDFLFLAIFVVRRRREAVAVSTSAFFECVFENLLLHYDYPLWSSFTVVVVVVVVVWVGGGSSGVCGGDCVKCAVVVLVVLVVLQQ